MTGPFYSNASRAPPGRGRTCVLGLPCSRAIEGKAERLRPGEPRRSLIAAGVLTNAASRGGRITNPRPARRGRGATCSLPHPLPELAEHGDEEPLDPLPRLRHYSG
jgi:hypothetical protein